MYRLPQEKVGLDWIIQSLLLADRLSASVRVRSYRDWIIQSKVGPDIKGSRWAVFLLSVSWNWHPHTVSGQRVLILFISHSRRDRYRQCLCLEQLKIRQTSSGRVVSSEVWMIEHWYLACMILMTSTFYWYHEVTLTFDEIQGQIRCRAGDHNSLNFIF